MPTRNDTSLTLDDLILRVAEASGIADYSGEVAAVPTSSHDYDLCRRAVNDGIEMIYRANPRWRFLMQPLSILLSTDGSGPDNIGGDAGRYALPWYVSGAPTESSLTATGSGGTTYCVPMVSMKHVREARSGDSDSSGPPRCAAIDRVPGEMASRSLWELVVWPDPDYAYTLSATFRVFAPKLVGRGDRHVMGAEHDQTVVAAAIYARKLTESKDQAERENYKAAFNEALQQSVALDAAQAPATLGQVTDPSVMDNSYRWDFGDRANMAMTNGVP